MKTIDYGKRCAEIVAVVNKILAASSAANKVEKRVLTMNINVLYRKARYLADDHRRVMAQKTQIK